MSVIKVVIHSVDNQLNTVVLSEKQVNLNQNVELDTYILKLFNAFKKSNTVSKGLLHEESMLYSSIGSRDFEFMDLSKSIAQAWFDDYVGSTTYTSLNLIFAMIDTEDSVEFVMFEVMGRAGYLKVSDDIEQSMGILSDSFASIKTAFAFDLESGEFFVKLSMATQEQLESVLKFETIPNAKRTLEIVDVMVDYLATQRDSNILEDKIRSKQVILEHAELFDEVETKRIITTVFEDLSDEEKNFVDDTIMETHLPAWVESTAVNRLSSRRKHRIVTEKGLEIVLPLDELDVDAVLAVEEKDNGEIDIRLKNVGKLL